MPVWEKMSQRGDYADHRRNKFLAQIDLVFLHQRSSSSNLAVSLDYRTARVFDFAIICSYVNRTDAR
jgi:hypothetical protein